MDSPASTSTAWTLIDEPLAVWTLGYTDAGAIYAMVAPYGWVRLAVARHADALDVPDWPLARARLARLLADQPAPGSGEWTVAAVTEVEREVTEFGPMVPAPDMPTPNRLTPRPSMQVWRVECEREQVGWLLADSDACDAALVLAVELASHPASRTAARQVVQDRLNRLPGRSRWRLRIVAEEHDGQYTVPAGPLASSQPEAMPTPKIPASIPSLGIRQRPIPTGALLGALLIVVLCVAIYLAVGQLRQRLAPPSVPALAAPTTGAAGATGQGLREGASALVVAPRLTPLRKSPGDKGKGTDDVVLLTAEGQVVRITGGPRTVDGRRWWQVSVDNQTGWLPETLTDGAAVLSPR